MFRRCLKGQRGYSLIEVMVSIMILAIAILPMVSMFDAGLRSATASSNYDKARTLGNLKMEEAKSLPFDSSDATRQDVKDNFPEAAGTTTTYDGSGRYQSPWKTVSGPATADFANFHYRVEKQYMKQPSTAPGSSSENFLPCTSVNGCTPPTTLIRVTVTVGWGTYNAVTNNYSKTYTTFGLVTA